MRGETHSLECRRVGLAVLGMKVEARASIVVAREVRWAGTSGATGRGREVIGGGSERTS